MSYYGPQSGERGATKNARRKKERSTETERHVALSRMQNHHKHNKRLRKEIRPVPWRDEWELQDVGKGLLSVLDAEELSPQELEQQLPPNSMSVSDALEMISVWKSRLSAAQGLPHSIESTASIAQIYWRDSLRRQHQGYGAYISVMERRLAYSSAVIRCINGFADTMQQERNMATSVSSICTNLGIPIWVVDVRHEASHNALPSIEILRMAASTLLEFLKTEYWMPKCPEWRKEIENDDLKGERITKEEEKGKMSSPIDLLQEYEDCATIWASRDVSVVDSLDRTSTTENEESKKKKSRPPNSGPPKTKILSYDPLFGEVGILSSSDDDDDDDEENLKLDEPIVGNIFGSAIGTNMNRFAILEPPSKKKKKEKTIAKKKKKVIQTLPKRQKGEKSPTDCAKRFVRAVSPHNGYGVAIRFLVWGGAGESSAGIGVFVPRSDKVFPAIDDGVSKCWQRYSPLIYVICRSWPGFCSTLLVHLVDFVLSIESQAIDAGIMDPGSARKLYFLSAWIHLLLSNRFVAALDEAFQEGKGASSTEKKKSRKSFGLTLARAEHLQCLEYPLHSLLERCRQHQAGVRGQDGADSDDNFELLDASKDIHQCLIDILGPQSTSLKGQECNAQTGSEGSRKQQTAMDHGTKEMRQKLSETDGNVLHGPISLVEMEALLFKEDNEEESVRESGTDNNVIEATSTPMLLPDAAENSKQEPSAMSVRPAWVRCETWDPCAIGALPGYPA